MIIGYLPTQTPDENGKWYKEFEVPEGLPVGDDVVFVGPGEDLLFPRFDYSLGMWVEDKDSIIAKLKTDNEELSARSAMLEGAMLELADSILTK